MSRGFFAMGVFHSKCSENIGTLFRSADAFGAALIFTVGRRYAKQVTDVSVAFRKRPCINFSDVDDLKRHLPLGCRLVGVELADRAKPLAAYHHPELACYLLGAEDHGLSPDVLSVCHEVIVIPGASKCLNVASAGSIVMYDRIAKERTTP